MENKLMVFKNKNFGEIRSIEINNEPYFVGKDIAEILIYKEPHKAIVNHIDEDDRIKYPIIDELGRKQETWIINESGLYSLIMGSKLPSAKKFKKWVTSEVLPTLRKTGGYIVGEENLNEDELILKAMNVLNAKVENLRNQNKMLENKLEEQQPKVLFANSVETSKTSILVGELAKILKQNGHEIGQNRLFEWLRNNGYLISRRGTDYNMPTQKAMDLGLFEIKETSITHSDGHISVNKTPKVTGKGQVYFVNKFIA